MAGTATEIANVDQWLLEVCDRHASAEVHFESPGGPVSARRVRLNRVTDTHLYVECSRLDRHRPEIPVGTPVTVHVSLRGTRSQFSSVVVLPDQAVRKARRDPTQTVLWLRRPERLDASQRRAHLRISVAGLDPVYVTVVPVHPEHPDACAIDASPVRTAMVNVSAGGIGLLAESDSLNTDKDAPPCFLSFSLPNVDEPFDMLGELRSARYVKASESWRVGYAFHPWSGRSFGIDQSAITRFITEQERRALRRRR